MHKRKRPRNYEGSRGDMELPPRAGAIGNEVPTKRKKADELSSKDRGPPQNAPSASNVLPAHTDAPKPSSENLAGAPELALRGWSGAKDVLQKSVQPWINSNVNAESHIHFQLQTGAYEWIHVNRKSISLLMYTARPNPNHDPAALLANGQPNPQARATHHSVQRADPHVMIDPDVGGRSFFNRIEVIINDQVIPTNNCLGPLFTVYPRFQAIFAKEDVFHRKPHFKRLSEWGFNAPAINSAIMQEATRPFSFTAWNDKQGHRVYVPMDGQFPFDLKTYINQAIENTLPQVLFIGPSTKLEVKLYFMPTRLEGVFHNEVTRLNYYDMGGAALGDPTPLELTLQGANMEYLSVELYPTVHAELMSRHRGNKMAYWDFDIVRGQHQPLSANVSYAENIFTIFPYARSLLVAFMPNHATFVQAHTKRPLSGWSTFPRHCTKIHIEYGGVTLGGPYINFGVRGIRNELSMSQYYDYLTELGLATNLTFEDLFPSSDDEQSLVQYFVFDVRHLLAEKNQQLRIGMEFSNQDNSPDGYQVAVVSMHPNGRADVKNLSMTGIDWEWIFRQSN